MDRLKREGNPPVGQLASPVPQYKDVGTEDWEIVQGEAGASYVKDRDVLAKLIEVQSELEVVKAELAAIKAQQTDGSAKVTLSGTIMEVHVLVNALAIVDTDLRTASVSSVGKDWEHYSRFEFYVRNTLDSDIRIGFGTDHGYLSSIPGKNGEVIPYTPASTVGTAFHLIPPVLGSGSRPLSWYPIANPNVLDPLAYQKFVGVSGGSNLVYRAVTAPTKGSLSIWFVGWKA